MYSIFTFDNNWDICFVQRTQRSPAVFPLRCSYRNVNINGSTATTVIDFCITYIEFLVNRSISRIYLINFFQQYHLNISKLILFALQNYRQMDWATRLTTLHRTRITKQQDIYAKVNENIKKR